MIELVSRTTQFYPPSLEQKIFPELLDIVCQRFSSPRLYGEGGMGIIIGENENPTKVAKIVQNYFAHDLGMLDWFEQEYTLLRYLSDLPGMVQVSDPIIYDGRFYGFLMEYLSHLPLARVHSSTPYDVVSIFLELAVILQHVNSRGIFHRDIKLSNILVDIESPENNVKLIDFGVSFQNLSHMNMLDSHGVYEGDPSLASPEVTFHALYADMQSEIFSFGSTLYEYLSGETFLRCVYRMGYSNSNDFFKSGDNIDLSAINPLFQPIIQKCMAYSLSYHSDGRTCIDRSERYNNFMEVAADLMDLKKHFCQLTESDLYRHYICD